MSFLEDEKPFSSTLFETKDALTNGNGKIGVLFKSGNQTGSNHTSSQNQDASHTECK
jgi:hypothetical protein